MDYTYTYTIDQFPNQKIDLNTLITQIRDSRITIALDYINSGLFGETNYFKAELLPSDVSILNTIVANHTGEPAKVESDIVRSEVLTEHIKFVEAGDTTQGMYAAQSIIIDISANESTKIVDFTWPLDIALMSGTLGVAEDMVGDGIMIDVGPNTLVGVLVAPMSVGDTSIYVNSTVIENIKKGFYFGLYGGPGNDGHELGQVIDMDPGNGILTLGTPADTSANAMTPVAMCAKIIPNLYLHDMSKIEIGKQIPTGQRIPKNVPVRITYSNNNGVDKKISFFIEYLY